MAKKEGNMFPSVCFLVFMLIINHAGASQFADFGNIAEKIGNLFGATDDCVYKCPNGEKPRHNPNHKPTANGCGSYGITFDVSSMPGMTECCNTHDYCYDTCNKDKALCDKQLKDCLQGICDQLQARRGQRASRQAQNGIEGKDCHSIVQMVYGGASVMGCDAYKTAQKNSCTCAAASQKRHFQSNDQEERGFRRPRERYLHNDL